MMCSVPGRAVKEVPFGQLPLLALDDQGALSREHEERLLPVLAVVHPDPFTRLEHADVDAEVREPPLPLEGAVGPKRAFILPTSLARVHDEPPLAVDDETVLAHPGRSLGHRVSFAKHPGCCSGTIRAITGAGERPTQALCSFRGRPDLSEEAAHPQARGAEVEKNW
jgi:hypothetical protein